MAHKRIKQGQKELNIYDKENSLTLIEMYYEDRMEPSQCIQLTLTENEVKELIKYLQAQLE